MSLQPSLRRALVPWLLAAVLAGIAWSLPPIAQPPGYHDFADQRACRGLPNCLDTASNALFMLAGAIGLFFMQYDQARDSRARSACDGAAPATAPSLLKPGRNEGSTNE